MSNSRNWVAQKDCPYAAGSVDVSTGATPEHPGDATFGQAFGAGPIDVRWALEDSNDPPRAMAGVGQLSGGSIDVSSPSSTFDGTTYDDSPSGAITLTSPVIIRCTLSGEEYDNRLGNALFPEYAGFTVVDNPGQNPTVDFSTGNKQRCSDPVLGQITLSGVPGVSATYLLKIDESIGFSSIVDDSGGTVTWLDPIPTWAVGKEARIACDTDDGVNWFLAGSVES